MPIVMKKFEKLSTIIANVNNISKEEENLMKRIIYPLLVVVMVAGVVLAGCAQPASAPTPTPAPTPTSAAPMKIGALTSCWQYDYAWGTSNYRATMLLKDIYGADILFIDLVPFADQVKVMTDFANSGCQIIIAWGYEFLDAVKEVALKYPEIYFVMTCAPEPGTTGYPSNVASLYFREEEPAYVAGVLAVSITKTHTVGYITGMDQSCTTAIANGYRLGVFDTAGTDVKVIVSYVGSWADVAKERELTNALIDSGCDVILTNGIGVGVSDVIAERTTADHPLWHIGNQYLNEYTPEIVPAVTFQNHPKALQTVYLDILAGKFVGKPYECDQANGISVMRMMDNFVGEGKLISPTLADKLNGTMEKIATGQVICSRLRNIGIRVMPASWPSTPVDNIGDYLQPTFEYVFPGADQPANDYLRR